MDDTTHSIDSGLREKVLEHLFLGEMLRCLWRKGVRDIEVLRAEVDRGGHDLVVVVNGIMRHVQLKASFRGARTREVSINSNLEGKPHGCVIWIRFDPVSMDLGPYLWFGGRANEPMPSLGDRIGRHTRGSRNVRPNIRVLSSGRFVSLGSMGELVDQLFGFAH
jgi:hypothetical protein